MALADDIKNNAGWLLNVFAYDFRTLAQWKRYFRDTYTGSRPITDILNKIQLSVEDFHALYIACWTYHPVAKGSFMIRLDQEQRANVKRGYNELTIRASSHYEGHGRSAARGWSFLSGYDELLVQMEGEGKNSPSHDGAYVFLKCEGHTFTDYRHYTAWYHKIKTGHGHVDNPALEALAVPGSYITARAAENFDREYEILLKYINLYNARKKLTTISAVAPELDRRLRAIVEESISRRTLYENHMRSAGLPISGDINLLDSSKLSKYISDVLIPTVEHLDGRSRPWLDSEQCAFLEKILAAKQSLLSIAKHLGKDTDRLPFAPMMNRHFAEVRVNPSVLDAHIVTFRTLLNS